MRQGARSIGEDLTTYSSGVPERAYSYVCRPDMGCVLLVNNLWMVASATVVPTPILKRCLSAQAYPLDLVRTRLSAQTKTQYYQGIWHALATITRDEGARGLYR